ncbi:MAG: 16S rRNA (adenine(1518)-N(6)/adenine(1519)-N(6))-dimethyltransferase RsmA [Saprospiraceae bacterium]
MKPENYSNFVLIKMINKAKKSYGQHFLIQQKIIDRIANTILHEKFANVLEIGPGKAALTKQLLGKIDQFLAVEADKDMIEFLHNLYPLNKDVFIQADFLKLNLDLLFSGESFLLCGNFPYNISSQIVFKAIQHSDRIPVLIGMFQKEMAQRIISKPGSKDYGIISAISSLYYSGKIEFDIGPGNFNPPPKVVSSVLILKRNKIEMSEDEKKRTRLLIKSSFQFRRKTLRNNLKSLIKDQDIIADKYFDQRPEDIAPLEYLRLSRELNY